MGIWLAIFLGACTLRIGSRDQLPDQPAPTTIPLAVTAEPVQSLAPPQNPIALPPGFVISVYAQGLRNPRMLAIGPDGQLYVAERGANRIVRLPDVDGNGLADQVEIVADDLNSPSSLVFYQDGSLYVGLTDSIVRLNDLDTNGVFQQRETVIDSLPTQGHNTRTVLFSPDGSSMFVSIGSSCNVCDEDDPRRAAIVRYNPDGSGELVYASGLRNAVGITFRPGTDELWATNNGRDMLGDDQPPETIYRVNSGGDYGWPRCHAGRIVDPDFGADQACEGIEQPVVEIQAHSAPLGLTFYTGDRFPADYQGDLFVALHGSWNRSVPIGYKVVRVPMDGTAAGPVQDFATGWLVDEENSWGRPVDVITGADGALYISDDGAGVIYRVDYLGTQ
jgi:glucose/arabinose dehydrogenase